MKKYLFVLFILPFVVFAQGNKIEFEEYDLENGLHVILSPNNTTPIVAISLTYHVGSKNEQPDRTGFAHFFEHLMFEGSDNIPRGEYSKYVQNAGGQLNAATSFDQTMYYEVLPSNQAELGLWLESERMLHLKIDSIGVETQRRVVKEERKQTLENRPYGSILEKTFSHAFTQHPYRWTPIGSAQYIDKAGIDEFRQFHKTFYVPNNAVLSIAGDFKSQEMKTLVARYFADIPAGKTTIYRPEITEPEQQKEVRDTVLDNIQLPAVIKAYHMPAQGTDDYYALNMLTTLLSSGKSSRLYKSIVDKQQKALFSTSIPLALEDPGLFIVYSVANMSTPADTLEKLMNIEIKKVQNELISESEFAKLRNQIENSFAGSKNTNLTVSNSLAKYYLFFGKNTDLINSELDLYMKVTRQDIQNAAVKYLNDKNSTVLYYLPKNVKTRKEK